MEKKSPAGTSTACEGGIAGCVKGRVTGCEASGAATAVYMGNNVATDAKCSYAIAGGIAGWIREMASITNCRFTGTAQPAADAPNRPDDGAKTDPIAWTLPSEAATVVMYGNEPGA
jgi:hypothetical protein